MNSVEEIKLRKKVSENVTNNINIINELLTTNPQSTIVQKAEEFLKLCKENSEGFISETPSAEYYDLKQIEKLASLMEIEKISFDSQDAKKRLRVNSERGSRTSLASFPSSENIHHNISSDEVLHEIQSSINDIKENLAKTSNKPLNVDFLHEMKTKDFRRKAKFISFVADLKRLQNELEKIALSDDFRASRKKSSEDADDFEIDDSTISDVRTLNKKITDMKMLQKKPAEELEKPELVNFNASAHIDRLLELMGRILS